MGRSPCCSKEGLNRGAWTAQEDKILRDYIHLHGEGKWRNLPQKAGLKRCGKSCRLRWLNYLRPDIKRGNISQDEEELIMRLHKLLGNRWSLIAGRLPGRTDNEIKNYWNTNLVKKVKDASNTHTSSPQRPAQKITKSHSACKITPTLTLSSSKQDSHVIRTKASKCSKLMLLDTPPFYSLSSSHLQSINNLSEPKSEPEPEAEPLFLDDAANNLKFPVDENAISTDFLLDFNIEDVCLHDLLNTSGFSEVCDFSCNDDVDLVPFLDKPMVPSVKTIEDKTLIEEKNVARNNFVRETVK